MTLHTFIFWYLSTFILYCSGTSLLGERTEQQPPPLFFLKYTHSLFTGYLHFFLRFSCFLSLVETVHCLIPRLIFNSSYNASCTHCSFTFVRPFIAVTVNTEFYSFIVPHFTIFYQTDGHIKGKPHNFIFGSPM